MSDKLPVLVCLQDELQSCQKLLRGNGNTCLAQYIGAKTAIFKSPPPRFNVESL